MTTKVSNPLETMFRDSGLGWMIDSSSPPDVVFNHFEKTLANVSQLAQKRLGPKALSLNSDAILAEYERNPSRIKGFLQAFGSTSSPEMLLMVWRILQGMEIAEMRMNYSAQKDFFLEAKLTSPYGEEEKTEIYQSTDIEDAALLRHLGIMKMDDKPLFAGFYPLRIHN